MGAGWEPHEPEGQKGGARELASGIVFQRYDGKRVLVMLGTAKELPVTSGQHGQAQGHTGVVPLSSIEARRPSFTPTIPGKDINMYYNRVRVDMEPRVQDSVKFYMVDIEIELLQDRSILMDSMKRAERLMSMPLSSKEEDKLPISKGIRPGTRRRWFSKH